MKKTTVPLLILIILVSMSAASVSATEVKLVTVSNGLGWAQNSNHRVLYSIGAPFVGRTVNTTTHEVGIFGFWAAWIYSPFVSAVSDEIQTPANQLFRNFPNPFNPSTQIGFTLEKNSEVSIELYDLRGRRVDIIYEGDQPAGAHSLSYQPKNLASGAYVILMKAGSFRATQRIMLVK